MQQVLMRPLVVPEFAWIRAVAPRGDGWLDVIWGDAREGESTTVGTVLMQPPAAPLAPPRAGDLAWLRTDGTIRSWTDRHDGRFPDAPTALEGPVVFALAPGDCATVTRFENPAGGTLPFPRAFEAIRALMIEKRPTKGEAWREQSTVLHVARMSLHVARVQAGDFADPSDEDDLVHAVVRGLMALEQRQAARKALGK